MRTQWRTGAIGPVGLDYCAAFTLMDRMHLDPQEWDEVFEDLRLMEQAALAQISENASET